MSVNLVLVTIHVFRGGMIVDVCTGRPPWAVSILIASAVSYEIKTV